MTSKHKKAAAARARVGRAAQRKTIPILPSSPGPAAEFDFNFLPDPEPIEILTDSESDSDCEYTGGVNCHDFDMDSKGYADEDTLGSTFSRFPQSVRPSFYVMGKYSNRPPSRGGISGDSRLTTRGEGDLGEDLVEREI